MSHGSLEFCLVNGFCVLIKVEYAAILVIYILRVPLDNNSDMRTETACQSGISITKLSRFMLFTAVSNKDIKDLQ